MQESCLGTRDFNELVTAPYHSAFIAGLVKTLHEPVRSIKAQLGSDSGTWDDFPVDG